MQGELVHEGDDEEEIQIVQERRCFVPFCCLGCTWLSLGWRDVHGYELKKGQHPSTREYRHVAADHPKAKKDWDWGVIIDEKHTDPEGWQYSRCLLPGLRAKGSTFNREHVMDCVKQRRWVQEKDQAAIIQAGKRGSISVLTPVKLRQRKAEKQRRWEEGMADVWRLLDELDQEVNFRSLATALLDPVALKVVASRHTEIMRAQKAHALEYCPAVRLLEEPCWPVTGLQNRLALGIEDILPKTEAAHDFAQGFGDFVFGISRLPHHVSCWSQKANASIQNQLLDHKRRANTRKALLPSPPHLGVQLQPQPQRTQLQQRTMHHVHHSDELSGEVAMDIQQPRQQQQKQQQQEQEPISHHGSRNPGSLPTTPTSVNPITRATTSCGSNLYVGAAPAPVMPKTASYGSNLDTGASSDAHSSRSSPQHASHLEGNSSFPPRALGVPATMSTPHPSMQCEPSGGSSPEQSISLGVPPVLATSGPNVILATEQPGQKSSDHRSSFLARGGSLSTVTEGRPPTPSHLACSVPQAQLKASPAIAASKTPSGMLKKNLLASLASARRSLDPGTPLRQHQQYLLQRQRQQNDKDRLEHDYDVDPYPKPMELSLPELNCATGHALAIYGDLEEPGEDGMCLQTYCGAIEKYTGVPESDVLLTVWRSQVFEPGHYVCVDRQARKIVLSVRGTMETVDTLTDVVGRPVPVCFQGLRAHHKRHGAGVCHAGMLGAATSVFVSASATVVAAHQMEPKFDILVTGHSLGGGAASVLAILLRGDSRLPRVTRSRLRAVCLAPAASISSRMSRSCRHFMVSIIFGSDIVPRVDLASACNFLREVAEASPLRRLMTKLGKNIGMPWNKVAEPAGTAGALGATAAVGSASFTMAGKGYAGTRFITAAAQDAWHQQSVATMGNESSSSHDEISNGNGSNGMEGGESGNREREKGGRGRSSKKGNEGNGERAKNGGSRGGESGDKVGAVGGMKKGNARGVGMGEVKIELEEGSGGGAGGVRQQGGPCKPGGKIIEVDLDQGNQQQQQQQQQQQGENSVKEGPVPSFAVEASTRPGAQNKQVDGERGLVDESQQEHEELQQRQGGKGRVTGKGKPLALEDLRGQERRQQRELHHSELLKVAAMQHPSKAGEDDSYEGADESLFKAMVPPGLVYWILRAPVPQLTVASQRSSVVLVTPRETTRFHGALRVDAGPGSGSAPGAQPTPNSSQATSLSGAKASPNMTKHLVSPAGKVSKSPNTASQAPANDEVTGAESGGHAFTASHTHPVDLGDQPESLSGALSDQQQPQDQQQKQPSSSQQPQSEQLQKQPSTQHSQPSEQLHKRPSLMQQLPSFVRQTAMQGQRQHKHMRQRQSTMLGFFGRLGSRLDSTQSNKHPSTQTSPSSFQKSSLSGSALHFGSGEHHPERDSEQDAAAEGSEDEDGSEVEGTLGGRSTSWEDEDVSQLVLLQVDDKMITAGFFDQMLFFKQAITDHLPISYLKALRSLIAHQKTELAAERSAKRIQIPPQNQLEALRRAVTHKTK